MKRSILLVGGSATELAEVREGLAALAPDWECLHVATGLNALDVLTRQACDAVVTDLQLGDLTGLQLLTHVMTQWPQTHRIILADLGAVDTLLRCVGGAHQFLARPCEAERLKVVLDRAFTLDLWLPNEAVRSLLGSLPSLPSPILTHRAIAEALERQDLDSAVGRIAEDPPLAAKVLQLANSAAYGPPLDEADPTNAARELGATNVRRMFLLAHAGSAFRETPAWDPEDWGFHSRRVARLARRLAQVEGGGPLLQTQSATAGLLHDLGKLALAANLPDRYREVRRLAREDRIPVLEAEQHVFGATHGEIGGCLLGLWGLPMAVVEAVALHHRPAPFVSHQFGALTAVHVANILDRALDLEQATTALDWDYLVDLGLGERLPAWWQCRQELAADSLPR